MLHNRDLRGLAHSGKPVRNNKNSAALQRTRQSRLNMELALRVNKSRWFVKKNNRCLTDKCARNSQPLALTPRKAGSVPSNRAVQPKAFDTPGKITFSQSINNFIFGKVWAVQKQIIRKGMT